MKQVCKLIYAKSLVLLCAWGLVFSAVAQTPNFSSSNLDYNGFPNGNLPTSISFGPDDRLYVLDLYGTVYVYTVQRNGVDDYQVTAAEELSSAVPLYCTSRSQL